MSKHIKGNNKTKCYITVWDEMIAEGRERIADIERAIKLYMEKRDAGEPWPGTPLESATHN